MNFRVFGNTFDIKRVEIIAENTGTIPTGKKAVQKMNYSKILRVFFFVKGDFVVFYVFTVLFLGTKNAQNVSPRKKTLDLER